MIDLAASSGQMSIELPSIQATERYAYELARCLFAPMVITLRGQIGAGKTTLVRALLRALGVQGAIKSPTYSLLESYDLPENAGQIAQCHHFDLYRVMDDSELEFIGFRDYFQPNTLCLIEWPERIPLPAQQIDLALLLIEAGNGRTLHMQANAKTMPLISPAVQNYKKEINYK